MKGYEVYEIFFSVQLHFRSPSYNYIRYNGKSKCSLKSYLERKDQYWFEKMGSLYTKDEILHILFAWFSLNPKGFCVNSREILRFSKSEEYNEWKSRLLNVEYNFVGDLKVIRTILEKNGNSKFKKLLLPSKKSHFPNLVILVKQSFIKKETYVILDKVLNVTEKMGKFYEDDDLLFPEWKLHIKKYSDFFQVDKEKYKKHLTNELGSFIMNK